MSSIELNNDEWFFEADALVHRPGEITTDRFGMHYKFREFRLSIREQDGALIGEEIRGGAGLALWFFPVVGVNTDRYVWPRLKNK